MWLYNPGGSMTLASNLVRQVSNIIQVGAYNNNNNIFLTSRHNILTAAGQFRPM